MKGPPLTRIAQDAVSKALQAGALAIDATAGNGHDTVFLAHCVAPGGQVYGFDIQPAALASTRARLQAEQQSAQVALCAIGHEHMASHVPTEWRGKVSAIMFNLGYLPGGDKSVITDAATTVAALNQALELLRPGGLVSLLQYRGHAGADAEVAAVDTWIKALPGTWCVQRHASPGPVLYLVQAANT